MYETICQNGRNGCERHDGAWGRGHPVDLERDSKSTFASGKW
jgi:hypothetical protein